MANSPKNRPQVSSGLKLYNSELFLAHQERDAFKRYTAALNLSLGTYISGGINREAKNARVRGVARACAHALVDRALSGKTRENGLSAIAAVADTFSHEIERLYDVYNKNSGGSK